MRILLLVFGLLLPAVAFSHPAENAMDHYAVAEFPQDLLDLVAGDENEVVTVQLNACESKASGCNMQLRAESDFDKTHELTDPEGRLVQAPNTNSVLFWIGDMEWDENIHIEIRFLLRNTTTGDEEWGVWSDAGRFRSSESHPPEQVVIIPPAKPDIGLVKITLYDGEKPVTLVPPE